MIGIRRSAKRNAAEEAIAALVEALDRSFRPGDILTTDPVPSPSPEPPLDPAEAAWAAWLPGRGSPPRPQGPCQP